MRPSALILGAAAALIAACTTPPLATSETALNTSRVEMHVGAGYVHELRVASMNGGDPLEARITITDPHFTTQWLPLASLCVTGDSKEDFSCIHLRLDPPTESLIAASKSSFPSPLSDQVFAPFRAKFGQQVKVVLKYDARGYAIDLDGQSFPVAPVDFEITGYAFSCSSARCRFEFI